MKIFIYSFILIALNINLVAKISSTIGSLHNNNVLYYQSNNTKIKIDVKSKHIKLVVQNGSLIIGNQLKIKKVKEVKASKKLLQNLIGIKTKTETIAYDNITNKKNLTKKNIEKHFVNIIKKQRDLKSYKIIDINIPKDIEEYASIKYTQTLKIPFKNYRVIKYSELFDIFLTSTNSYKIVFDKEFILSYKGKYFLANIEQTDNSIDDKITKQNIDVSEYSVKIVKQFKNQDKTSVLDNMIGETIFKISIHNRIPYTIQIVNQQSRLERLNLVYIDNKYVQAYLKATQKYPVELTNFNFKREQIRASYKVNTPNGIKYLATSFKMVGKRKNVVAVKLEGSSFILDPKKDTNMEIVHEGYLLDAKTFQFEVKKVLKQNGTTKLQWKQSPKKSMLTVNYKDNTNQMITKKISKGRKQFYDLAGIWYLMSWNNQNNIDSKAFLLMKQDFPFEAKYIKTNYGYLVQIKSKDRYKFYLDKYSRVNKVEDLQFNLTIQLNDDGFTTNSIDKNRQHLSKQFKSNNLIKVNIDE